MLNPSSRSTLGQSRASFDPRAEQPKSPLGYKFDPIPQFALDLLREGKIEAIDIPVITTLLRFRNRLKHSCWCSKATIAAKVGCSTRTVQRSLYRLGQAGLIAQEAVDVPDPDEPRNRTGWRIVFLWLAPAGYVPRPGPNRPGLGAKKGPRHDAMGDTRVSHRIVPPETPVSPPPETPVSPPPETPVSPNYAGASKCSDGFELDGEKQDGCSSSSSERDDDDDTPFVSFPGGEGKEAPESASIEAARICFGDLVADKVRDDARRIERLIAGKWECYEMAIYQAKASRIPPQNHLALFRKIAVEDFAVNGISAEARAAKSKHLKPEPTQKKVECLAFPDFAFRDAETAEAAESALIKKAEAELYRIDEASAEEMIACVERARLGLVYNGDKVHFTRFLAAGEPRNERPPAFSQEFMGRLRALKTQVVEILRARYAGGDS